MSAWRSMWRRPGSGSDPGGDAALAVRVDRAGAAVDRCRQRFDPGATAGMPPHVTVLYPAPPDRRQLEDALLGLLAEHDPFRFELTTIGHFPGVWYLCPQPAEPFVRLTEAVAARLGTPPYGGRFGQIVPHLTVAHRRRLPSWARRGLERSLPIVCEARTVDLLHHGDGGWRVAASLALGRDGS